MPLCILVGTLRSTDLWGLSALRSVTLTTAEMLGEHDARQSQAYETDCREFDELLEPDWSSGYHAEL